MFVRFASLLAILLAVANASAASYRTHNFVVTATSPQLARVIGDKAEQYRRELAIQWLGGELPQWSEPCPVTVFINSRYGAGGETSFHFESRRPTGWAMTLFGPEDQAVLNSVLPHEVAHTVFATYFGCKLPRWAEEGACTTVEGKSEREKLQRVLNKLLPTQRRIPLDSMLTMSEYPRDIVPFYTQGHSLASFLIVLGGKQKFIRYIREAMELRDNTNVPRRDSASHSVAVENWASVTRTLYGFEDLAELESAWLDWVKAGSRIDHVESNKLLVSGSASKS